MTNGKRIINLMFARFAQQSAANWNHTPWSNDTWTDSHRK